MSDSRGISRRRFVAGAAGAALAVGTGASLLGCGGSGGGGGRGRVVVVGAGLAGLTAAWELDRKGWDVTVLEARDRVGGRCRTFRQDFRFGQFAEAGAEFVEGSHEAVRGYAGEFGLKLDELRTGQAARRPGAVFFDGRRRAVDAFADSDVQAEVERYQEQIERYAAAIDVADPARTGAGLDTRSVADLLDELALDGDARLLVEARLREQYTVDPDRLSLLFHVVLSALAPDAGEEPPERYRIRGGNDRLPAAFADRLRRALVLDSPVESVQSRAARVTVVAAREKVEADYCVIATPLPVLREVELDVELPRAVRDAIATLQYGEVTRTALQYERRFWQDDELSGETLTDLPIGTIRHATDRQRGSAGILTTSSVGEAGARLGAAEPAARIEAAVDQVADVYPRSEREFMEGATISWGRERYSRGSYSAWAPGQFTRFWPALRRSYGRVYFAGEHTDLHAGSMEGAVRSGRRTAEAIEARGA